jgi:methionyl aminopeptidase
MRAVGSLVRRVIDAMSAHVRSGVTTAKLDAIGSRVMREHGGRSAPALVYRFPGANCISVNDEAVHGIPGSRRLCEGDIVKLDVTIEKDGFMADAAVTVPVGSVSDETKRLIVRAQRAFSTAMRVARAGVPIRHVGRAIEREVEQAGFSVISGASRTRHRANNPRRAKRPELRRSILSRCAH